MCMRERFFVPKVNEDMEMEAQISGAGHKRYTRTVFRHVRKIGRMSMGCLDQLEV